MEVGDFVFGRGGSMQAEWATPTKAVWVIGVGAGVTHSPGRLCGKQGQCIYPGIEKSCEFVGCFVNAG